MKISTKRLLSYMIDMGILLLLVIVLKCIWWENPYEIQLSHKTNQYFSQQITKQEYQDAYLELTHQSDKQDVGLNVVTTLLLIVWFIIIPNLNKGQTVGQKIMKLKTVGAPLTMEQLIGRCVIIGGLGYVLLMFVILYLVNDKMYLFLINFFAFFQIIVVITHGFMVLYKKDYLGLADNLTKTRIEEIK